MDQLAIQIPSMKPLAESAQAAGALINPPDLGGVRRVVLAVKPAKWRDAAESLPDRLSEDAVILSVMAGVRASSLAEVFGPRPIARVMPTTAVATAKGTAAVWSGDAWERAVAHALFEPIASLVDVEDEGLIDVATAVSGSGAAYAYAFVRALARAGEARGLSPEQALVLARATTAGALSRLEAGDDADALIAEVASPGGTTQAGMTVLEPALTRLIDDTVEAALDRARELTGS